MAFNQFPSKGGIPSGNTAGRPSNPVIGDTYYNGEAEILEIYNGTQWVAASAPPAVPTIVSVTDSGTGLAYATGGTFAVVVAPGSGGSTPLQYNVSTSAGGFSTSSSSTTISLTGLTSNTSFVVLANAQNNFGTTVNSNPFSSVTATTVPQAPTIGTATASTSANETTVTWTLNSNGGKNLSAITITPYLNGTTAQTSRTAATTSSTSYTFTDGQLNNGSAYTFKVKTTNANGTGLESAASNSITAPTFFSVDYLVVAGGGGGGVDSGGGAGAGGMRCTVTGTGGSGSLESAITIQTATNYSVAVGAGGAGAPSGVTLGTNGVNSTFSTITSTGGGYGGSNDAGVGGNGNAAVGGSGGGAGGGGTGSGAHAGAAGTSGQGFAGGTSYATGSYPNRGGGGGGGASAVGATSSGNTGTAGGAGRATDITGSSVTYAAGGAGVGAESAGAFTASQNGTANRGNGANAATSTSGAGGTGGSGVVVLRYPDTRTITFGAGLTGTESSASGGYKRATITAGSGNVSWA